MQFSIDNKTAKAYADYASKVITERPSNKISVFNNPSFGEIRMAIDDSGEPWFCLADVCRILALRVDGVMPRLREGGYNRIVVTDSLGRNQEAIFVNEQNLYRVIMRSDKPNAEPFQDWVCGEVLPSIRKTGQYAVKPLTPAQQLLANAQMLVEIEQRQMEQEYQQRVLDARQTSMECKIDQIESRIRDNGYMAVVGFANIYKVKLSDAMKKKLGRLASSWCRRMGVLPEKIKHERWGFVNTYPMQALRDVFKATYPDKSAMFDIPTYWG